MVEKTIDISLSDRELRELIAKKGGLITPMVEADVVAGQNFYDDNDLRKTNYCGCHNS